MCGLVAVVREYVTISVYVHLGTYDWAILESSQGARSSGSSVRMGCRTQLDPLAPRQRITMGLIADALRANLAALRELDEQHNRAVRECLDRCQAIIKECDALDSLEFESDA